MDRIAWRCPNCGAVLGRPPLSPAGPFGKLSGVVRCIGCKNAVSASDVYDGKYDIDRQSAKSPVHKKRQKGSGLLKTMRTYFRKLFGRDLKRWERKWGRKLRCWECYWYAEAQLDGVKNKGICNLGTGQIRPFTMAPGDAVSIAWGHKRACAHFHPLGIGPPKTSRSKGRKRGRS
jgi:hypothetical protein